MNRFSHFIQYVFSYFKRSVKNLNSRINANFTLEICENFPLHNWRPRSVVWPDIWGWKRPQGLLKFKFRNAVSKPRRPIRYTKNCSNQKPYDFQKFSNYVIGQLAVYLTEIILNPTFLCLIFRRRLTKLMTITLTTCSTWRIRVIFIFEQQKLTFLQFLSGQNFEI